MRLFNVKDQEAEKRTKGFLFYFFFLFFYFRGVRSVYLGQNTKVLLGYSNVVKIPTRKRHRKSIFFVSRIRKRKTVNCFVGACYPNRGPFRCRIPQLLNQKNGPPSTEICLFLEPKKNNKAKDDWDWNRELENCSLTGDSLFFAIQFMARGCSMRSRFSLSSPES